MHLRRKMASFRDFRPFLKKGVLRIPYCGCQCQQLYRQICNPINSYSVYIKRGERRKLIGTVYVNIVSKISV